MKNILNCERKKEVIRHDNYLQAKVSNNVRINGWMIN